MVALGNLQKVFACANWAVEHQKSNGAWVNFAHINMEKPYSSMAQGEGISLLLRAYNSSKNQTYLNAATKAVEFMLTPVEKGGVTKYDGDDVYLMEFLYLPLVLNGWIFSTWGLLDYCKVVENPCVYDILKKTCNSLKNKLADFDTGFWSMYAEGKIIASPFYHKLHIAQLNVMFELTGETIYKDFANRWAAYQKSFFCSRCAFIKKAMQKVLE